MGRILSDCFNQPPLLLDFLLELFFRRQAKHVFRREDLLAVIRYPLGSFLPQTSI